MMCPYYEVKEKQYIITDLCVNYPWCTLMDEDAMCLTGNTDNCPYGEGGNDGAVQE